MIAIVRIAPVERWCDRARKFVESNPNLTRLAGLPVSIVVESRRPNRGECSSTHEWKVPRIQAMEHFRLAELDFDPNTDFWICGDMLEMD